MTPTSTTVMALHWQHNVIHPDGVFGPMLAEPVASSGVVERSRAFHDAARDLGVPIVFTRFTIPSDGGGLVRNTDFMRMVDDAAESFRPDSWGAALVDGIGVRPDDVVSDNQRLSGLAETDLPERLRRRGVDTLLITGVATNLTVEQTARHATDLGFMAHVISDCVAAADEATHDASLANLSLTTNGVMTAEAALSHLATPSRS
ncbi:MAG: cysteine hydrolase [Euzebya tangerina]|nr:cysteine hydrolase [Euzebya tangerina]